MLAAGIGYIETFKEIKISDWIFGSDSDHFFAIQDSDRIRYPIMDSQLEVIMKGEKWL